MPTYVGDSVGSPSSPTQQMVAAGQQAALNQPLALGQEAANVTTITKTITRVSGSDSVEILSINKTDTSSAHKTSDPKRIILENKGRAVLMAVCKYATYSDGDTQTGTDTYMHFLLTPGTKMDVPINAVASSSNQLRSLDASNFVDFTAPDSNAYVTLNLDTNNDTATDNIVGSATNTTLYIEDYTSAANCGANVFKLGDTIRVGNEIMEVTGIGAKAALATNTLTVRRGIAGSTAASDHADDADIRMAFYNNYLDFDSSDKLKCTIDGKWWSKNFFGYGRKSDSTPEGIVPTSIAFMFYKAGYQECGLTGITPSTPTGLTGGTTYKLDITVDGGTKFQDLEILVDSSDQTFGSVIKTINTAFDAQFYANGHLREKKVICHIVDGDVRFTSGQHGSDSAILLEDTGDANSLFDAAAHSRFPIANDLQSAVAAKLPDKVVTDPRTGVESPNTAEMAFDDGNGFIRGACNGKINYSTGEIMLWNAPSKASFEFSFVHSNVWSGAKDGSSSTKANTIESINAYNQSEYVAGKIKVTSRG